MIATTAIDVSALLQVETELISQSDMILFPAEQHRDPDLEEVIWFIEK